MYQTAGIFAAVGGDRSTALVNLKREIGGAQSTESVEMIEDEELCGFVNPEPRATRIKG